MGSRIIEIMMYDLAVYVFVVDFGDSFVSMLVLTGTKGMLGF